MVHRHWTKPFVVSHSRTEPCTDQIVEQKTFHGSGLLTRTFKSSVRDSEPLNSSATLHFIQSGIKAIYRLLSVIKKIH